MFDVIYGIMKYLTSEQISGDWTFFTEGNPNVWYYGQKYQELCQLQWRRPWNCIQDNTGSYERVPYFVLANSVKFIVI